MLGRRKFVQPIGALLQNGLELLSACFTGVFVVILPVLVFLGIAIFRFDRPTMFNKISLTYETLGTVPSAAKTTF